MMQTLGRSLVYRKQVSGSLGIFPLISLWLFYSLTVCRGVNRVHGHRKVNNWHHHHEIIFFSRLITVEQCVGLIFLVFHTTLTSRAFVIPCHTVLEGSLLFYTWIGKRGLILILNFL